MRFAALGLALGALAGPAAAEIAPGGERPAGPSQGQAPTRVGAELEGEVGARCWQEGREIVSENAFATAAIPPGLREQAINLRGRDRSAVLLPLGQTFCLLTVSP